MTAIHRLHMAVAGAGVLGLCAAIRAATAGARVEVFDPKPQGANASRISAGMIAPLGEALFDEPCADRWRLLRSARDLWLQTSRSVPGLTISRSDVVFQFPDAPSTASALEQMHVWGVQAVGGDGFSLRTSEDWWVDPPSALAALTSAFLKIGGRLNRRALTLGDIDRFDAVVLAGGYESRRFRSLAPELDQLTPIKGHILSFPYVAAYDGLVRSADVYLVAQPNRLIAGATMQPGQDDLTVEPRQVEALRDRVIALRPDLKQSDFESAVGIRAATPDGMPMVGRTGDKRLLLATGARRNGWLLAPLVAEILLAYLSEEDGGPLAAVMNPARFSTRPSQ